MKQNIYIYGGPRTSKVSIEHTLYSLKKFWSSFTVSIIKADDVIAGEWITDAALFIMPGGADRPYGRALNGAGNAVIKKYIEDGGSYLGICAGAYYGASHIEFALNSDLEIKESRELKFFAGTAKGPTLAPYNYQSNSGARVASLLWHNEVGNTEFMAFFNGGCHFSYNAHNQNATTLASYQLNNQPAIVMMDINHGRAILTGVHIEYDLDILDLNDPYLNIIYKSLIKDNSLRQNIFNRVVESLINDQY